jgi:hypothetical protein
VYAYSEEEGGKGGNNAVLLIMKHLQDQKLLDGKKRKRLNIVMDNCPSQEQLCLEAGAFSPRERIFCGGQFHILGGWTHQECHRLSFQYSKKTLQKAECFHGGNAA